MLIEQRIWQQIANGDKEVYAAVYRELFPRFFNNGRKFTEDTLLIEDVAQEALLSLWESRSKFNRIKNVEAYFY